MDDDATPVVASTSNRKSERPSKKRPRPDDWTSSSCETKGAASARAQSPHHDHDDHVDSKTTTRKTKTEQSTQSTSSASTVSSVSLTPHILRLLKLIQEGTTDHARLAATHLIDILKEKNDTSSMVLWQVLGRLQAFLTSSDWRTRHNACLAMEGVARQLPLQDQLDFLQRQQRNEGIENNDDDDDHHDSSSKSSTTTTNTSYWLTLQQLQNSIPAVLEQGRQLLSTTEGKYEDAEKQQTRLLQQIWDDNHDDSSTDNMSRFVQERLQMQRQFLARRLGLAGIFQQLGGGAAGDSKTILTEDDLILNSTSSNDQKRRVGPSHKPLIVDDEDTTTSPEASKIRNLLVLVELQRQEKQQKSSNHHRQHQQQESHTDAQCLLAGELVYRMFDPSWHIRHGSLIGLLALLRAWNVQNLSTSSSTPQGTAATGATKEVEETTMMGMWPHDILARCLCVLVLDRFGDYSGATAGSVVAPVREMAGQVIAVLFWMTPESLQRICLPLLSSLIVPSDADKMSARGFDWEVQHGSLIAIKYIVALLPKTDESTTTVWKAELVNKSHQLASVALVKHCDDVQSVAAEVLHAIYQEASLRSIIVGTSREHVADVIQNLWIALGQVQALSSCTHDLLKLLCVLYEQYPPTALPSARSLPYPTSVQWGIPVHSLLNRLKELLDCEYTSVRRAVLVAIGTVCSIHSTTAWLHCDASSSAKTTICQSVGDIVILSLDVFRKYALHFDGEETKSDDEFAFQQECHETWEKLAEASDILFELHSDKRFELEVEILKRYFHLEKTEDCPYDHTTLTTGRMRSITTDLARTTARFLNVSGSKAGLRSSTVADFLLLAGLESPMLRHYELSCLLMREILRRPRESGFSLSSDRAHFREMLHLHLSSTPRSLHLQTLGNSCDKAKVTSAATAVLASGLKMLLSDGEEVRVVTSFVFRRWKETLGSLCSGVNSSTKDPPPASIQSVRTAILLCGATIAGGVMFFPEKLTPIVRALMNAVINEKDETWQTCSTAIFAEFLQVLSATEDFSHGSKYHKTYIKVVENLCRSTTSDSPVARSNAGEVLAKIVTSLPSGATVEYIHPIWEKVKLLQQVQSVDTQDSLTLLSAVSKGLPSSERSLEHVCSELLPHVVGLACRNDACLKISRGLVMTVCATNSGTALTGVLPALMISLRRTNNLANDDIFRATTLMADIVKQTFRALCPYVRSLLPIVMSLMTDPEETIARTAASTFSQLVQLAPLVTESISSESDSLSEPDSRAELVMEHLIRGNPLPACVLPQSIQGELQHAKITLRPYQMEGVAWLRFLQTLNLNGALCDAMGLGKTLQALIGVALAHDEVGCHAKSIVVSPSSVVGHWMSEISRFFPKGDTFTGLEIMGGETQRQSAWCKNLESSNLVVVSYSTLRSDIERLRKVNWTYCILDEGHLMKNPKTKTAQAARKLKARHKVILTGTPVQNHVNEIWAVFDFLMPNFLGRSKDFATNYTAPIVKGQQAGSNAEEIASGIEKLKVVHQQVLPFLLRREKQQVLKELPPKTITTIPCEMTANQRAVYSTFCSSRQAKDSLTEFHRALESGHQSEAEALKTTLSSGVLKSLLYLRLVCTHPSLVSHKNDGKLAFDGGVQSSGKLVALQQLLGSAGMKSKGMDMTAADNDTSLVYCDIDEDDNHDDLEEVLDSGYKHSGVISNENALKSDWKCLIFAQFTHSLDAVEKLVLQMYFPDVSYMRLDGRVPPAKRTEIVKTFNEDDSVRILLLTTRIGGLGLNLTGADTVIFLEHDWNPHNDLQAMDRAHRIGQKKSVQVFRLVTRDSIEEKMMALQQKKIALSDAIVNSDNSTLFSMGTDRLLDIFRYSSESNQTQHTTSEVALDALVETFSDEYQSLSVGDFLSGFATEPQKTTVS